MKEYLTIAQWLKSKGVLDIYKKSCPTIMFIKYEYIKMAQ